MLLDNRFPNPEVAPKPINGKHHIECRVYQRHPCAVDVTCQPVAARDEEDPIWSGRIKDISQGGAGLVLTRRFERGAALAIEVPLDDGEPDTHLARVIHVRPSSGGQWLHGCEFVSKLSDDELVRLLGKKGHATTAVESPPQRNNERTVERHRAVGSARWRAAGAGEAAECAIHDVSALGMALRSPQPISLGNVLEIELRKQEAVIATVQARAVNVMRQRDEAWIIGCSFVEELRTETLLPLHDEARRSRAPEVGASYPCEARIVFLAGDSAVPQPIQARIVNVAAGAISVVLPRFLPNGSVFELYLPRASASRESFLLRVVMATEHWNSGWLHGCEFASRLSEGQLQALKATE